MKKSLVLIAFVTLVTGKIDAQSYSFPVTGVLGEYPYLYYYNFPQIGVVMEDSVLCTVTPHQYSPIGPGDSEYVLHMYTDTPIEVAGLATGYCTHSIFTLYGSNRSPLGSVEVELTPEIPSMSYFTNYFDTNYYHYLLIPGLSTPGISPRGIFKFNIFLKDSSQTIVGDFYIGVRPVISFIDWIYQICEDHPAPYHFVGSEYHTIDTAGLWSPMYTSRVIPLLFPIIKPECVSVDSVTAVSDSAGCITVDWEPQPVVQTHWFVHFSDGDSSGFNEIADTCHLRRCGLLPGTTYTVSIQGQCRDLLEDQYYSPWSDSVTVTVMAPDSTSATDSTGIDPGTDTTGVNPGIDTTNTGGDTTDVGIRRVALPEVTLTPNPTHGTVTVGSSAQLTRIEVYDPQGRLLRTVAADGTTATLDLAALPPAVYTLIIHTTVGTQTRKLTVAR